ncbi:hypothetical protein M758_UG205100 [Ceratodon purpureus]|nr:hypothetical protein M758_UG205100 [Ceratodon purpureus]
MRGLGCTVHAGFVPPRPLNPNPLTRSRPPLPYIVGQSNSPFPCMLATLLLVCRVPLLSLASVVGRELYLDLLRPRLLLQLLDDTLHRSKSNLQLYLQPIPLPVSMAPLSRFHDKVAQHPRSVEELAPWLTAVDEWRRCSTRPVPPPRFLLDLVVPGAEWFRSVGAAVERLEMEWYSNIPYPLPVAPTSVTDSNVVAAPEVLTESVASVAPFQQPVSPLQSVRTSEWLRVVEDAMPNSSAELASQLNTAGASGRSAAPPSTTLTSSRSASTAALDSKHSCFPPRGKSDLSDSYDCRENMQEVFAFPRTSMVLVSRTPRPLYLPLPLRFPLLSITIAPSSM